MQSKLIIVLLLLITLPVFSQKEKRIQGKIIVKNSKLEGIRVVNLMNEKEVFTDTEGRFEIVAKPDDLLIFSAEFIDYMRKIVEESDYKDGLLSIEMTSKIIQLDEVEIKDYSRINAVNLGILARPAKEYTPAERRLQTATGLYPSLYAGTLVGGSIGLDPLINWISGRTAMLKKALKAEEKQFAFAKLDGMFDEIFYTETLKIPKEEIGGFQYFIVEDVKLSEALKEKNSFLVSFFMIKLATDYKAIRNAK